VGPSCSSFLVADDYPSFEQHWKPVYHNIPMTHKNPWVNIADKKYYLIQGRVVKTARWEELVRKHFTKNTFVDVFCLRGASSVCIEFDYVHAKFALEFKYVSIFLFFESIQVWSNMKQIQDYCIALKHRKSVKSKVRLYRSLLNKFKGNRAQVMELSMLRHQA
jgi:hypothetical protein